MNIGSAFSGIGGLDYGLELSGIGRTTWQIEIDPYCRSVLARHWPHVHRYEDIRECGAHNLAPVDLLAGGFPCQDVSAAGSGAGLNGARSGLWWEFHRLASELAPEWIVVENVASGAKRWVDAIRGSLGQLSYETLPIPIAAADVGAPHLRRRIFVVAHAHGRRCESEWEPSQAGQQCQAGGKPDGCGGAWPEFAQAPRAHEGWAPGPPVCGVDARPSTGLDRARLKALGNAVVPQCAQVIGEVIRLLERETAI